MKSIILLMSLLSVSAFATTFNVGTYVGTLREGNNETGKACTVEIKSKAVSSSGANCFKYVVTSKDLEIASMEFNMRYDVIKGNDRSCSNFNNPEHIEEKAKAYMMDDNGNKSVFINRMKFILNHKILNCHDLVQVK